MRGLQVDEMITKFEHNGDTYATDNDGVWPLTPCCQATGKGSTNSDTGVICRACYDDVDPFYGDFWTHDEWKAEL
jgi:hypothetical protein